MIHYKWGITIALVFIASIVACLSMGVTLLFGFVTTLLITSMILNAKGIKVKTPSEVINEAISLVK